MHPKQFIPLLGLLATATATSYTPSSGFIDKCTALASQIQMDQPFTVNIAAYMAPNATIDHEAEGLNETCIATGNVAYPVPVGLCRVNLRVETSDKSEVYMEAWLPENWKGRTLMTGNGGMAGCIQYFDLAYGASLGFATFGTNAGHNGTSGGAFYQNDEVWEDYSWRAVYTGTQVGKAISNQFYSDDCGKSYFFGCSTGGRQGFKAVQQNPELFDGVVVGAPAINLFSHVSWWAFAYRVVGTKVNDTEYSRLEEWAAIFQKEALKQCDGLDGAVDGVIEDDSACKFDWTALQCPEGSDVSTDCLTEGQINGTSLLFQPLLANETLIHSGHSHGYEPALLNLTYSPMIQTWVSEAFRNVIYNDQGWDPDTFTLKDALNALKNNPANANTFDSDISAFRDRGGKILHWHGTADPILASSTSTLYRGNVQEKLNASSEELDDFYRYFRASGVGHCNGGPGANVFGQLALETTNSEDDLIMQMVQWVEADTAPEFLQATKYVNNSRESGVEFRRKHCKYPLVNHYNGTGDGKDEEGWQCVDVNELPVFN